MTDDLISRQAAKLKVARVIWEDGDSCYDFHDKCVDCLDDVPPAQPEQRWIPCDERLPDGGGKYLISVIDGIRHITTTAMYQPRYKTWDMMGKRSHWRVIAWMPLPEPYKGGCVRDEVD